MVNNPNNNFNNQINPNDKNQNQSNTNNVNNFQPAPKAQQAPRTQQSPQPSRVPHMHNSQNGVQPPSSPHTPHASYNARTPRSKKSDKKPKFSLFKLIRNIIIVAISLLLALFILEKAPNYKNRDITDKTNLIINNNNITAYLKKDVIIENDVIYLSRQDIANFFDPYLYFNDEENRIVITYDTKVTNMFLNNTSITVNDVEQKISASAFERDDVIYIPFSELSESFNMDLKYNNDTDIITVDTLSREQVKVIATKNLSVKSIKDNFSRTVAKIKKNEEVILIEDEKKKSSDSNDSSSNTSGNNDSNDNSNNDSNANVKNSDNEKEEWAKIRTSSGVIGYVKKDTLANETVVRTAVVETPQIEGKVNLVWDNFYVEAPDRSNTTIEGLNVVSPSFFVLSKANKGEIDDKVGIPGINYINWAHSNNYKVWPMVSNIRDESMIETTSEILNSYELRNKVINNIVSLAVKYDLDGINIDFENMYQDDKDAFTQFIVELYPRLKEKNVILSVDVTAPDGGETWSMCYDRHDIANNCDYIVFMAYDQYGESSKKAGTTAGLDWIKVNLNKFLKTEEIEPNKIILGLPFYTRIWTENSDGSAKSEVVDMRNITKALPTSAYNNKVWNEDLGQYYVEYTQSGKTKKMWIEDERSIKEKLNLVTEHNLGGAAFWAKDRESKEIWSLINDSLN